MTSRVRSKPKPPMFSGPPRVRYEPPTVEEAVAAAQDLAADAEQQVTIAAGLANGHARGPGPVPGPQRSSEAGVLTPGPGLGPADPLAPGRGGAASARRPGIIRGRGGGGCGPASFDAWGGFGDVRAPRSPG